ncbi:YbjN domain-containing protein [Sphingomonas sp. GlSt437]|uniref:YbjN domain-containing protein n=1 Tax=Sphingomonas sp. GlSt437 TaxID=3389970 RepID=UPI003A8B2EDB
MYLYSLSLLALMISTASAPAFAKDYPNGGVTGEDVVTDLKAMEDGAVLTKDSSGDPMVSASFKIKGAEIPFQIFFYGCKEGRCSSLQYFVSFTGSPDKAVAWNSDHRFARLYYKNGKVRVEYDVDVEIGANSAAIQNATARFHQLIKDAVDYAG